MAKYTAADFSPMGSGSKYSKFSEQFRNIIDQLTIRNADKLDTKKATNLVDDFFEYRLDKSLPLIFNKHKTINKRANKDSFRDLILSKWNTSAERESFIKEFLDSKHNSNKKIQFLNKLYSFTPVSFYHNYFVDTDTEEASEVLAEQVDTKGTSEDSYLKNMMMAGAGAAAYSAMSSFQNEKLLGGAIRAGAALYGIHRHAKHHSVSKTKQSSSIVSGAKIAAQAASSKPGVFSRLVSGFRVGGPRGAIANAIGGTLINRTNPAAVVGKTAAQHSNISSAVANTAGNHFASSFGVGGIAPGPGSVRENQIEIGHERKKMIGLLEQIEKNTRGLGGSGVGTGSGNKGSGLGSLAGLAGLLSMLPFFSWGADKGGKTPSGNDTRFKPGQDVKPVDTKTPPGARFPIDSSRSTNKLTEPARHVDPKLAESVRGKPVDTPKSIQPKLAEPARLITSKTPEVKPSAHRGPLEFTRVDSTKLPNTKTPSVLEEIRRGTGSDKFTEKAPEVKPGSSIKPHPGRASNVVETKPATKLSPLEYTKVEATRTELKPPSPRVSPLLRNIRTQQKSIWSKVSAADGAKLGTTIKPHPGRASNAPSIGAAPATSTKAPVTETKPAGASKAELHSRIANAPPGAMEKLGNIFSRLLVPADVASQLIDITFDDNLTIEQKVAGWKATGYNVSAGLITSIIGAKIGAAAGALVPLPGATAIGGFIGAVGGYMTGAGATHDASKILGAMGTGVTANDTPMGRSILTRSSDFIQGINSYNSPIISKPEELTSLTTKEKDYRIGELTRTIESGGDYSKANIDWDPSDPTRKKHFGYSYGAYQFNNRSGLIRFLKWLEKKDPAIRSQLKGDPNSEEFNNSWRLLANNPKFADYQDEFWKGEYFDPAISHAKKYGFKVTDKQIAELIGSTANQRPGRVLKWLETAAEILKKSTGKKISDLSAKEQLDLLFRAKEVEWRGDNDPNRPALERKRIGEFKGELSDGSKPISTTSAKPKTKPLPPNVDSQGFSKYTHGDSDEKKVWLRNIELLKKQGKDPYEVYKSNPATLKTLKRLGIDIGGPKVKPKIKRAPVAPSKKNLKQGTLTPGQQNFLFNSSADASGTNMKYRPIEGLDNLSGNSQTESCTSDNGVFDPMKCMKDKLGFVSGIWDKLKGSRLGSFFHDNEDAMVPSIQNRIPMPWMFSPPMALAGYAMDKAGFPNLPAPLPSAPAPLRLGYGLMHKLLGGNRTNLTDGTRYQTQQIAEQKPPVIIDNSKTNNISSGADNRQTVSPRTNDDSFRRYMDRIANFSNIG